MILDGINEEVGRSRDKVTRLRLHQILKRKVEKQKRESQLSSSGFMEN